jgi:hypothetical protein
MRYPGIAAKRHRGVCDHGGEPYRVRGRHVAAKMARISSDSLPEEIDSVGGGPPTSHRPRVEKAD